MSKLLQLNHYNNFIVVDDIYVVLRDTSSEYDTEKINAIDENLFKLNSYFSTKNEMSMLSLYGDRDKILKILNNLFETEIKLNKISNFKQRITAIYNDKIFVLALFTDDDSFLVRPICQESILITLTRILQDITKNIIICPFNESLQNWWTHASPYRQSHFKPIDLIIRKRDNSTIKSMSAIKFDENLITKEYSKSYMENLRFTNNYTKFCSIIKACRGMNLSSNQIEKNRLVIIEQIYNYELEALEKRQQLHPLKLQEIFKLVLNVNVKLEKLNLITEWHIQNVSIIKNFEKGIHKLISEIVGKSCRETNFLIFSTSVDAKLTNLEDILNSLISNLLSNLSVVLNKTYVGIKLKKNFIDEFKDYFELLVKNGDLETTKFDQKNNLKNFEKYFSSHSRDLKKMLVSLEESFNEKSKLFNQKYNKIYKDLVTECKERNELIVHKTQFNVVRDEGGKVKNVNISLAKEWLMLDSETLKLNQRLDAHDLEVSFIYPTKHDSNELLIININGNSTFYISSGNSVLKKCTTVNIKDFYFTYCPLKEIGFIYDYEFKRTICVSINESGKYTEGKIQEDTLINNKIISSAFIEKGTKVILLTEKSKLYKFDYENQAIEEMVVKTNSDAGIRTETLRPSINGQYDDYIDIASNYEDDMFILRSSKCIDFYNINLQLLHSLKLNANCIGIKYFTDKIDSFLVIYYKDGPNDAFMFEGLGSCTELLKNTKNDENLILGNPLIDCIYGNYLKYGANSEFLGLTSPFNTFYFYLENKEIEFKSQLLSYFNDLIKPLHHEVKFIEIIDTIVKSELLQKISIKDMNINLLLYSRVPIQICTIENNLLIPLKDGVRENMNYLSQIENVVGKAKLITFGFIEKLIEYLEQEVNIKVVCIIGRQSSGKSYLLNRIFGTRFSVAATRCTDGIWLSYCYLAKQHFLVLDCEGLFSIRRSEIEETKLMTLLSGICDITII